MEVIVIGILSATIGTVIDTEMGIERDGIVIEMSGMTGIASGIVMVETVIVMVETVIETGTGTGVETENTNGRTGTTAAEVVQAAQTIGMDEDHHRLGDGTTCHLTLLRNLWEVRDEVHRDMKKNHLRLL